MIDFKVKLLEKLGFQINYNYINKLFKALDYNQHQKQGRMPGAGMGHSSSSTAANQDLSRQPRGNISNKSFGGRRVVQVPNAVGGRACFPINVNKNIKIKLNKKERQLGYLHLLAHLIQNTQNLTEFSQNGCKLKEFKEKFNINEKTVYLYSDYSEVKNLKNLENFIFVNISPKAESYNKLYNLGPTNKNFKNIIFNKFEDLNNLSDYLIKKRE